MPETERQRSLTQLIAVGVLTGVGSALAAVGILYLLEVDLSPAVIGAVAGAVAGSVVPTVMRRRS